MKLIGAQKFLHSTTTTTTTPNKMFGIAKVARVLGARFFLQWFCIQKTFSYSSTKHRMLAKRTEIQWGISPSRRRTPLNVTFARN